MSRPSTTLVSGALALAFAIGSVRAQDDFVTIPKAVLDIIGEMLPENPQGASPLIVTDGSQSTLAVIDTCQVRMIFAWEAAGYHNSVGYYTYRYGANGIEILDADLLFPDINIDPGPLQSGDAAWLKDQAGNIRTFQPGDLIGFFLVADGWNSASQEIQNWTWSPGIPSTDPATNAATGRGCFTTNPELNPEMLADPTVASHLAMGQVNGVSGFLNGGDFVVMGFEDIDRATGGSDDDFNDVAFILDIQPFSAIAPLQIATYVGGDPDGDGVSGVNDAFPNDPDRAYYTRYPSQGYHIVTYEDTYPTSLDADFNDAAFAFVFTLITDRRNRVKDLLVDFHLVGRGAAYEHSFGLHIPGLPGRADGTVRLQQILSTDPTPSAIEVRNLRDVIRNESRRIVDVFASTRTALPPTSPMTSLTNTQPEYPDRIAASARVHVEFQDSVRQRELGTPPYDPYLVAVDPFGTVADIHLPGFDSFDDLRSPGLGSESGKGAFIDESGNPWALHMPLSWQFPLERSRIERAYPLYEVWRDSGGTQALDWYMWPTVETGQVSAPMGAYVPTREWTLLSPLNY